MPRMTQVSALPGYKLSVAFDDGIAGTIELQDRLFGPVFEPLRDETLFARVALDEFGAPFWPNGADLAPDAIYAQLTGRPVTRSQGKPNPSEHSKRI